MYLKPGMIAFLVACNCGKKVETVDTSSEDTAVEPADTSVEESDTSVEEPVDTSESTEDTGTDTGE